MSALSVSVCVGDGFGQWGEFGRRVWAMGLKQ